MCKILYTNVTIYRSDEIDIVNTSGDHRQTAGHEVPAPAL